MKIDGNRVEDLKIKGRSHPDWVIVLLHEGLGSVALWREFPQQLVEKTGCSVFAYSRLGYGQSDEIDLPRPLDFMQQEAKGNLPAVLEQLPEENIVLLGHSDGGSIASIYAGLEPDPRLRSLILMAPHFFVEPISVEAIAATKTSFEEEGLREKLKKYHGTNVDTAFWGWCNTWLHSEFRQWNIESFISKISVPTLFIQGWQDAYGTARQAEAFQTKATCETIIQMITGCGHHPFLEQRTKTLDAISQFLEGRPL